MGERKRGWGEAKQSGFKFRHESKHTVFPSLPSSRESKKAADLPMPKLDPPHLFPFFFFFLNFPLPLSAKSLSCVSHPPPNRLLGYFSIVCLLFCGEGGGREAG